MVNYISLTDTNKTFGKTEESCPKCKKILPVMRQLYYYHYSILLRPGEWMDDASLNIMATNKNRHSHDAICFSLLFLKNERMCLTSQPNNVPAYHLHHHLPGKKKKKENAIINIHGKKIEEMQLRNTTYLQSHLRQNRYLPHQPQIHHQLMQCLSAYRR